MQIKVRGAPPLGSLSASPLDLGSDARHQKGGISP